MGKTWPALDIHVPGCDDQLQDLVLAEIDDFAPTAVQQSDDPARLRAFFSTSDTRDAAGRALRAAFGSHLFVEPLDVDDEDWAARSQARLRAVTVGRVIVAPPWDLPENPGDAVVVLISPSMGFGTGHHATTRLSLHALQGIDVKGRSLLDIGCGSGVLAIAGAMLGAREATGIDIDPDALANARENAGANGTSVAFVEGDFRDGSAPADVVLANLTGGLLCASAAALASLVVPGGHLIVSGFMVSETDVLPTLQAHLDLDAVTQEDEWMCARLSRPHRSSHAY